MARGPAPGETDGMTRRPARAAVRLAGAAVLPLAAG